VSGHLSNIKSVCGVVLGTISVDDWIVPAWLYQSGEQYFLLRPELRPKLCPWWSRPRLRPICSVKWFYANSTYCQLPSNGSES